MTVAITDDDDDSLIQNGRAMWIFGLINSVKLILNLLEA